ncbi:hypothetical protein F5Y06DRAFT_306715 [Hypoxylon sp. FL0890]|nr:hypothetical protein F5Y06DRAFT_306715 [Hypoxylon sp. FL0890]
MSQSSNVFSGEPGSEYQLPDWVNDAVLNWRRNKVRSGESTQADTRESIRETYSNGGFPRVIFNGAKIVDLSKTTNKIPDWARHPSVGESTSRASSSGANQINSSENYQPSSFESTSQHSSRRSVNRIDSSGNNHLPSVSQPSFNRNVNQIDSTSGKGQVSFDLLRQPKAVNRLADGIPSDGNDQVDSNLIYSQPSFNTGVNQPSSNGITSRVPSSDAEQVAARRSRNRDLVRRVNGLSNRNVNDTPSSSAGQINWRGGNNEAFARLTSEASNGRNVYQPLSTAFYEILSSTIDLIKSRKRYSCFPRLINRARLSSNVDGISPSNPTQAGSSGSNSDLPSSWTNATFSSGSVNQSWRPTLGDNPFARIPPGLWPPERNLQCAAPFPLSPHDCGLACARDMAWLVSDRNREQLPPETPNSQRITVGNYDYCLCEDPVHSPGEPPRECQLVRPFELQTDMFSYITHPRNNRPTAVIPRAGEHDPRCPFCRVHPELHDVTYMCAFHMYYFVGVRNQDDFNVVKNLRQNPDLQGFEATSVEAMRKTIHKCRNLLIGSTPESGTHLSARIGTLLPSTDVGYIGQEWNAARQAIQSRAVPEDDNIFSTPTSINMNNLFTRRLLRSI